MEEKRIIINFPDVSFADVVADMKQRYPGLNIKTQAEQYVDLMVVVSRHALTQEMRNKTCVKVLHAVLIPDAFSARRTN